MNEVEAKFLINQSTQPHQLIEALQSCVAELTQIPTVDVVDRYFDTMDWKLLRGGWTYRWRDASGKRKLGLKSIHSSNGAIRTREEVEQEVEDFPAFGVAAPAGPVAQRLAKIRQDELRELFRINNHRQRFHLRTSEGALIELTLDDVAVASIESDDKAAQQRMQFAELELELIEGPESALRKLAAVIQQRLNLLPARLSKFERGLRPFGLHSPANMSEEAKRLGESSFLRKLRQRRLKRKNPMVKLAYRCLFEQFEAMLAEEPIAWEGLDIEGVHQMRVATRRLRAALWAFKSVFNSDRRAEFRREFKWLASVLGNVRDMDVFLHDLRGYIDQFPSEEALCLEDYRQNLEEQMKAARKQLIDCLSGDRYRTLKSNFSDFLRLGPSADVNASGAVETIGDAATRLLGRQYKRVLRDGRLITLESPDEELHALRIGCKRLRYLFEFFRTVYGKSLNPYIKPLKTLQNVLGEFQDANVARGQLFQYAQSVPMQDSNRAQLLVIGQLIASQRHKASDRRARFYKVWKRFDRRRARKQLLEVLS